MSHPINFQTLAKLSRRWDPRLVSVRLLVALAVCYAGVASAAPLPAKDVADRHANHDRMTMSMDDRATAMLASAAYQDVSAAEDAGYASSIETLGCFQSPGRGGMGVHYINADLMDATVDMTRPEALVYELDASGHITGLVAHEYIVPIDKWNSSKPPELFGMDFHRHPTLPLWVLHTWLWKNNPAGDFEDWDPAVRLCPAGVPIFGTDLPSPSPTT
jgi:hypothetical protein